MICTKEVHSMYTPVLAVPVFVSTLAGVFGRSCCFRCCASLPACVLLFFFWHALYVAVLLSVALVVVVIVLVFLYALLVLLLFLLSLSLLVLLLGCWCHYQCCYCYCYYHRYCYRSGYRGDYC